MTITEKTMRIAEVIEHTGLSREIIHHYIRQGLLPPSPSRAVYSEQQVQLLHQIKKLRDDHYLPLELIRQVFEFFKFDPLHLAPLTLADSLCKRMTLIANEGEIIYSERLSADELVARMGISTERLTQYLKAKLVQPEQNNGHETYSLYDADIIALCERGVEIGIPFDSFGTIGSYVRVGFELEYPMMLDVPHSIETGAQSILGEIFIRREIITSFIQNFLQAQISHKVQDILELGLDKEATLDHLIYRPSPSFIRRHGLDRLIEDAQEELCTWPESIEPWLNTAGLLLHAGRFGEAAFSIEKALERWPDQDELLLAYGKALILSGRNSKGLEMLEQVGSGWNKSAASLVIRALSLFISASRNAGMAARLAQRSALASLLDQALEAAPQAGPAQALEVWMLSGWIFTALPHPLRRLEQGLELLSQAFEALQGARSALQGLPGLRERYLINTAYLIFELMNREELCEMEGAKSLPSSEALRVLICSHDPGCTFAETVFLAKTEAPANSPATEEK